MAVSMSKKGRIVDLTRLAAKEIGIIEQGIGKVLVQKVEKLANK
jgi:rare lipoprotein A (peptidoglycan hydrolase)